MPDMVQDTFSAVYKVPQDMDPEKPNVKNITSNKFYNHLSVEDEAEIKKTQAQRTEKIVQDVERAVGIDPNAGDYLFEDDKFKNTYKNYNEKEKTLGYKRA